MAGLDHVEVSKINAFTDGTGTDQANGWFSSQFTVTTGGGVTVSLANADPLGGAGDDVPTSTVEGLKLRAIMICNDDATNYVTVAPGVAGVTSWIAGTTPSVRIPAGGMLLATFPAGLDALNDTTDDELLFIANSASCICRLAYIYG